MEERVVLKIIVLGSSNVGKTSLMRRFCKNSFSEARRATTGADFSSKRMSFAGQEVMLQIWDTAGQERFHHGTLGGAFYRGADAALLVYDATSASSFKQVENWRSEVLSRIDVAPGDFPLVVVGNKVDMEGNTPMDGIHGVDKAAVTEWCRAHGTGHIETSAKDGTGVQVAMEAIGTLALARRKAGVQRIARMNSLTGAKDSVNLSTSFRKGETSSGCGMCAGGGAQRRQLQSTSAPLPPAAARFDAANGQHSEEQVQVDCFPARTAGTGLGNRMAKR
uniref:Ras-related protein Rab n=1 Tax=Rhizochromulina marina TaxID=1034831 RepID=A0A7S2RVV0_9STRA|mmetsp:Transcript_21768/g.63337  ORF Transcript_21768/g.63337 Transcript_21768/m.63337 type:complete len:278 (+) Transcript_21768:107-940(+)